MLSPRLMLAALASLSLAGPWGCSAADPAPTHPEPAALAPARPSEAEAPEASGQPAPSDQASASEPAQGEATPKPAGHRVVGAWLSLGEKKGEGARVTGPEGEQAAAPLTVMLHGICNDPSVTCGWFRDGELGPTWQVCPAGPVPCGWGFQWAGGRERNLERVQRGIDRVRSEFEGRVAAEGAVLVGFSQGALAAVELARGARGAFAGMVLVGAKVEPKAPELQAAGVRRVGLAAGDFDGAAASMRHAAEQLARQGIEARYVSLGRVGHVIPDSTSAPIGALIEWARGR